MFKTIRNTVMGVALSVAAIAGFGNTANAQSQDYCREYTRTVFIGSRSQEAYGTACLQSDGSWMIVGEGAGNDIPNNVTNVNYIIHDDNRYVTPPRVVYYNARPNYHRRSTPLFVWYNNSDRYFRNGRYVNYNSWDRHDNRRWDRDGSWGHDDHRGRGNGRGHH